jgi:hypothetical protein
MKTVINRKTLVAAYAVAICADLIQIGLVPLVAEGFISSIDDFSDVVVCALLCWLVGFHVAFLPSFFIKLIPLVDIAPTWTLALFIATRHLRAPAADVPPVVDVQSVVMPASGGGESQGSDHARELK